MFDNNWVGICRMDIAKDIEIEYPCIFYCNLLENLNGKWLHKHKYNNTISFKNKSKEISFYDKAKHLKEKCKYETGKNLMRVELRLTRARSVKERLDLYSLDDLYKEDIFKKVDEKYKSILQKDVFYGKDKFIAAKDNQYSSDAMELNKYVEEQGIRGVINYFINLGINSHIEKKGDLDLCWATCEQHGISKSTIRYNKNKSLDRLKNDNARQDGSPTSLYQEIKHKLLDT